MNKYVIYDEEACEALGKKEWIGWCPDDTIPVEDVLIFKTKKMAQRFADELKFDDVSIREVELKTVYSLVD
jgi:hypothetical protein